MQIIKSVISNDNTKKYFFNVLNSNLPCIEACLLYLSRYGYVICVSSQIGCLQKCRFCAAGSRDFVRNLTVNEIQEQVELIVEDNKELRTEPFQVTYMGSGEPLSNFKNVFESIDRIREKFSNLTKVNISTICPSGAKECLESLDWKKYYNFLHFQYSLHFTYDEKRQEFLSPQLMPIFNAIDSLNYVAKLTNDTYKVNYIPFDILNDDKKSAEELINIMKLTKKAILKISKMCEINESTLAASTKFNEFVEMVKDGYEKVEVFSSFGTDVNAGCGQFYNESVI